MEHSGADVETMKAQFACCRGIGLPPFVRVPATEYHFIARMLDAGAMGIMVPMVETREQAERIVSCTRYPPLGRRGAAFGVAPHDDYRAGSVTDKIAAAHDRTLVICQVETATGSENVDAIAAVPGVDVVWLGHFDLTNFLGIPGEFTHPRYLKAVDDLLAACRRHGKAPGFMAADDAWAREYRAKGFRAIAYGIDVLLLQSALASGLATLRQNEKN
jgi:2-dehydro-3-deoxyglucarate aldolase/4-hydroxy-2-oxoheptanedioate aldolase